MQKGNLFLVTTKLMKNLTKCVTSKWSFPHKFWFCYWKFFFLLDKLRKHCHKFAHILQCSQSCEQEDFSSSNKFLHMIGQITTLITLSTQVFFHIWIYFGGFSLGPSVAALKMFFGRSHLYNISSVSLSWFSYFTSLLYFSYIILFALQFSF